MIANKSQTTPMFVGLEPDSRFADAVWSYKRRVRTLVGAQTFLDHPPHLTVYCATFDDVAAVVDATERLVTAMTPFPLRTVGWHVFGSDAMTGGNTLVCKLADDDVRLLRTFQLRAIEQLATLRNVRATEARYASRLGSLGCDERSAIGRWGFPYVGEHWRPHVTIASIRQSDWPVIERDLLASPPQFDATCAKLTLYRLDDGHPTPVKSFTVGRSWETDAIPRSIAS